MNAQEKNNKAAGDPAKVPTYEVALRIARIVAEMPNHPFGWALADVADCLGVHERTVRRYIKALAEEFTDENGDPVYAIEKRGGELKLIKRGGPREELSESLYHLVSAHLSLELFRALGHNVVAFSVEDIFDRALKKLSPRERDLARGLERKFFTAPAAPKDYSAHEDILEDAIKAVVYQNVVRLEYRRRSHEDAKSYTLYPYTLLYHKGGFYLIAKPADRARPQYFSIERITALTLLPEKFDYPRDYRPEQMLDGAFGIWSGPARTFTLKFHPDLADYVTSRTWHKSQKIKKNKDGSVTLTLHVADTEEVRAWIRSFGRSVSMLK